MGEAATMTYVTKRMRFVGFIRQLYTSILNVCSCLCVYQLGFLAVLPLDLFLFYC